MHARAVAALPMPRGNGNIGPIVVVVPLRMVSLVFMGLVGSGSKGGSGALTRLPWSISCLLACAAFAMIPQWLDRLVPLRGCGAKGTRWAAELLVAMVITANAAARGPASRPARRLYDVALEALPMAATPLT